MSSTLAVTLAPYLVSVVIAGTLRVLTLSLIAKLTLVSATGLQVVAAATAAPTRVLIPAAFALGTIAVTCAAYSSTRRLSIAAIFFVGGASNVVPIAATGAMPVTGVRNAGELQEWALMAAKHQPAGPELHPVMALLGDSIHVPVLHAIVSPGDVVLLAGFVALGLSIRVDKRSSRYAGPNTPKKATAGWLPNRWVWAR